MLDSIKQSLQSFSSLVEYYPQGILNTFIIFSLISRRLKLKRAGHSRNLKFPISTKIKLLLLFLWLIIILVEISFTWITAASDSKINIWIQEEITNTTQAYFSIFYILHFFTICTQILVIHEERMSKINSRKLTTSHYWRIYFLLYTISLCYFLFFLPSVKKKNF